MVVCVPKHRRRQEREQEREIVQLRATREIVLNGGENHLRARAPGE